MRVSRLIIGKTGVEEVAIPTGVSVVLTGQSITSAQGAITVSTGSSWSVTDVDLDESIFDGQTGVIVTTVGTVAASGKRVWLEQGGNWQEQTHTGESAQTITITVVYGILTAGAATLYVRNPL
jgi:hypothetical protein